MSANSSSNSSVICLISTGKFVFTAVFVVYILLLLPLFILVLYMGYQRWRKSLTSHSDVFTFHMVTLELIGILGYCLYCYGTYTDQFFLLDVGITFFTMISPGQILFHLLTCVERYLAVVHPVTYLGLRQAGGVRIRNICIGCVWLMNLGTAALTWFDGYNTTFNSMLLVFSSFAVPFCSICVLRALIRPGPGEAGGKRERVDQSKQRAFHTIMAIMGTLLLKFLSALVSNTLYVFSSFYSCSSMLIMLWSTSWFSLPSSLVLPLLFLHRAGKLPGCKQNTESV